MANVHDVAAYILRKRGAMSAMKLQKLVYYSQAWSLVWDDRPIFGESIVAWANGPVVYELFDRHRGQYTVDSWPDGDPAALTEDETDTIDAVLAGYGHLSAQQLSTLTHAEEPWIEAREGLRPGQRGTREIPLDRIAEYYTAAATDARSSTI